MTRPNLPLAGVWKQQENFEVVLTGQLAWELPRSWRLDACTGAISKLWRGGVDEWLSNGTVSPGCVSATDKSKIKQSSHWAPERRRPLNLMTQSNLKSASPHVWPKASLPESPCWHYNQNVNNYCYKILCNICLLFFVYPTKHKISITYLPFRAVPSD